MPGQTNLSRTLNLDIATFPAVIKSFSGREAHYGPDTERDVWEGGIEREHGRIQRRWGKVTTPPRFDIKRMKRIK